MGKNKIIFLDRDGTINVDYGYVFKKEKLEFIPGVIEGLKILSDYDYKFIVITNQSGIGRGYYTLDQYFEFNNYMIEKLKENNISILDVYFCPHIESDNCECRKPKTKLFLDAIKKHNIDTENSFVIGDKIRDLTISEKTNIKPILLTDEIDEFSKLTYKKNLLEAAKFIICDKHKTR